MDLTVFQWLTILGIPTLTALLVGLIFNGIRYKVKQNETNTEAVKKGVQALLRSQLYHCYEFCVKKGYASIDEKNNFENLYNQYHNMGKNGVMSDIYRKFIALPTEDGD